MEILCLISEDHTTRNIYFIRFRSRDAALKVLLQYGQKFNIGIADPGLKGQKSKSPTVQCNKCSWVDIQVCKLLRETNVIYFVW